jgi:hypothetical protein
MKKNRNFVIANSHSDHFDYIFSKITKIKTMSLKDIKLRMGLYTIVFILSLVLVFYFREYLYIKFYYFFDVFFHDPFTVFLFFWIFFLFVFLLNFFFFRKTLVLFGALGKIILFIFFLGLLILILLFILDDYFFDFFFVTHDGFQFDIKDRLVDYLQSENNEPINEVSKNVSNGVGKGVKNLN